MLQRQSEKNLYFSTKVELKINGVSYRPSICYQIPSLARKSLEKFEAEGKVIFYEQQVRFVNGAVAIPLTENKSTGVPSVVKENSEIKNSKRKNK
jgi:hypothetical protein